MVEVKAWVSLLAFPLCTDIRTLNLYSNMVLLIGLTIIMIKLINYGLVIVLNETINFLFSLYRNIMVLLTGLSYQGLSFEFW